MFAFFIQKQNKNTENFADFIDYSSGWQKSGADIDIAAARERW